MMKSHVYISPHLDDAVFSCTGRMLTESRSGKKVIVLTVFSGTGREPSKLFQLRRLEDDKALESLGVNAKRLNLPDAFFRRSSYYRFSAATPSIARLTQCTHPADRLYVQKVGMELERTLNELNPEQVYAPLAVGTHIDHRLVFSAAFTFLRRWKLKFYEDRPYSLIPFAVRFRLNQLGWRPVVEPGAQDMRGSNTDLICNRYYQGLADVSQGDAALFRKSALREKRSQIKPKCDVRAEIFRSLPRDLTVMKNAIAAYRSQLDPFIGSPNRYFEAIRKQGRKLGKPYGYFERYWTI